MFPDKKTEEGKSSFLKNVLIPIGSALGAALGLLAQNIPAWIAAAIGIYLVSLVLFITIPMLKRVGIWLLERRVMSVASRRYIPQIKHTMEGFKPQLDQSRTDTVFYVLNTVASWNEARGWVKPATSHLDTLATWGAYLRGVVGKSRNTNLESAAKETSDWIFQYARLCEDAYHQLAPLLTENKLDDKKVRQLKQDWNHVRDAHNRKVEEWLSLCRQINSDLGRDLCPTYCPTLKPLE
jgi:hypothetical protein